ncbi:AlpA family transcriptional regulator [Litoreibacter halocynthiae]|uniref:AlpA family transcriptional regulator n=1 Tax=Litoreibacter halocynthiae TaxID=1242689 RepID=A0A4R7LV53_9RHOB|nr:AlpA family transcriptional regulator [Litoreibacter halocynthiae]
MKFLSFSDLQAKLGGRGRSSIYRDFGPNGWLPKPTKIGSRLYWNEADVDAAIASLAD